MGSTHTEGTPAADRLAAKIVEGLPVTPRRLEVAGVSTALLEGGEGPPIMVLHGQGGFAEIMGGLIASLVDRHRVIAPDLPGMGRSVVENATLDARGVTRWLGELIAKTCDQPPVLLGVSMGGSIAARFAVERSDDISKLILVNSGSLGRFRPPPSLLFALIRMIRSPIGRECNACKSRSSSTSNGSGHRWGIASRRSRITRSTGRNSRR